MRAPPPVLRLSLFLTVLLHFFYNFLIEVRYAQEANRAISRFLSYDQGNGQQVSYLREDLT
jgi:hypothetical protein